jgi:hypothetical protein
MNNPKMGVPLNPNRPHEVGKEIKATRWMRRLGIGDKSMWEKVGPGRTQRRPHMVVVAIHDGHSPPGMGNGAISMEFDNLTRCDGNGTIA